MKKIINIISALTLVVLLIVPTTALAAETDATLISSEKIVLFSSDSKTRSGESKEFTLKTYNDNGVTVYSFDVEDPEYRQAAMEYINQLTRDSVYTSSNNTREHLSPGESEEHVDTQYDGDAMSYAWKRNNAIGDPWSNNFEGGQSSQWTGTGNCDYIILNQGIDINGFLVSVSWPPSLSGSGSSASWQSNPIYSNVAGASFSGLTVGGTAFSCAFTESGDVYVGNHIYRPVTYIKFSYFS